ncbi:DUF4245 domain-containing protein [Frankia gtarii]|uniref:DUF4245 domain-containing protein n=1 Tax=Frankia gtarii TaxID=2950102 RepID=UPI0021C059C3|nr:DUF4245 domain-containing protein [Frankia gtarii]
MAQRQRRGQETIRDMILSLAAVMAGVLVFVIFVMPRGGDETAVKVVATAEPMAAFARQTSYTPLTPAGLPGYWKPTSLRLTGPTGGSDGGDIAEAAIGYVIDRSGHRTYARLRESNAPKAVQKLLGNRPPHGTVDVDGTPWEQRPDADGHLAISRTDKDLTVIIDDGGGKGGATQADLVALAESLQPVQPSGA